MLTKSQNKSIRLFLNIYIFMSKRTSPKSEYKKYVKDKICTNSQEEKILIKEENFYKKFYD